MELLRDLADRWLLVAEPCLSYIPGMHIKYFSVGVLVALSAMASPVAYGQGMFKQGPKQAAPQQAPPPALPGASSNSAAAPANRPANDMEPTDALFDAINRGDIGAARDAVSRGAELNGRNVLGMTPIELSVDLGRNDISFMLLSMRGGAEGRPRQATAEAAGKPAVTRQARQAVPRPTARVSASPPSQTARLFGGDGGTPNPNAGFLGFDAGRR
jgi:hypothetical protein